MHVNNVTLDQDKKYDLFKEAHDKVSALEWISATLWEIIHF